MSTHLDEATLEAMVHGREDLAAPGARGHLDACGECSMALEQARALSRVAGHALVTATPPLVDVDALVAAALASVPPIRATARASRRSLTFGALVAAPAAILLGVASLAAGMGGDSLEHRAREAFTVAFMVGRLAVLHVPPIVGATVGAGGALLVALLALAIRALIRPRPARRGVDRAVEMTR